MSSEEATTPTLLTLSQCPYQKLAGFSTLKTVLSLITTCRFFFNMAVDCLQYSIVRKGSAYNHLTLKYKQIEAIALAAVTSGPGALLSNVLPELRSNRTIVSAAVRRDGMALKRAGLYNSDFDIVLLAVESRGIALKFADPELRSNIKIVAAAVKNNGLALQFVSHEFQDDNKEIVMAAVKRTGFAIKFASDKSLNHRDILFEAIKNNHGVLEYIPEKFRHDEELMVAYAKTSFLFGSSLEDMIKFCNEKNINLVHQILIQGHSLSPCSSNFGNLRQAYLEFNTLRHMKRLYIPDSFEEAKDYLHEILTMPNFHGQHQLLILHLWVAHGSELFNEAFEMLTSKKAILAFGDNCYVCYLLAIMGVDISKVVRKKEGNESEYEYLDPCFKKYMDEHINGYTSAFKIAFEHVLYRGKFCFLLFHRSSNHPFPLDIDGNFTFEEMNGWMYSYIGVRKIYHTIKSFEFCDSRIIIEIESFFPSNSYNSYAKNNLILTQKNNLLYASEDFPNHWNEFCIIKNPNCV